MKRNHACTPAAARRVCEVPPERFCRLAWGREVVLTEATLQQIEAMVGFMIRPCTADAGPMCEVHR